MKATVKEDCSSSLLWLLRFVADYLAGLLGEFTTLENSQEQESYITSIKIIGNEPKNRR